MEEITEIYDEAIKLGLDIDHHEGDLYIKCTNKSAALINKYKFKMNVTTFVSLIDDCHWYDIPFAYTPFWENKSKRA